MDSLGSIPGADSPPNWGSFPRCYRVENELAASLADSTGYEPEVAVLIV